MSPEIDSEEAEAPIPIHGRSHGRSQGPSQNPSWPQALATEVRNRPFAYGVMAVGLVLGPVLIKMIFPEVTTLQAVVGGLAFGVYAALSAVPQKFM